MKSTDLINNFKLKPTKPIPNIDLEIGNFSGQGDNKFYWLKTIKFHEKFKIGFLIINQKDYNYLDNNNQINPSLYYLITDDKPRYIFSLILKKHFSHLGLQYNNNVQNYLSRSDLSLGSNVYIGKNCRIGKNCHIGNNTTIHNNTIIGNDCIIAENTVIGSEGMGYEKRDSGEWIKFPQLGGVIIGDNVKINTFVDIKRGTLENTIIEDGCKIGSYCNIGHNCIIKKNALLTSHCVIAGSVTTGENLFMGINSSIRNAKSLGSNVIIGANSYINTSTPDNCTIIGTPGKIMVK